jgi:hypothetical protein
MLIRWAGKRELREQEKIAAKEKDHIQDATAGRFPPLNRLILLVSNADTAK